MTDSENAADQTGSQANAKADAQPNAKADSSAYQEPKLAPLLGRDIAIALAALSIWAAAVAWYVVSGLGMAATLAFFNAIVVGYVVAAIAHEWGHYAGARASGAKTTRFSPPTAINLFRFKFHFNANDQRQFHWMSLGGWVFHWSLFILLVIGLPFDTVGRQALVAAVFGFAVFATFIETGILRKTFGGADPAETLQQLGSADFKSARFAGIAGGLIAFASIA